MDITDILQRYAKHQVALNRRPATIDWYATMLRTFFVFMQEQGIKDLDAVEEKHIMDYQYLLATKKNLKGNLYCIATQNLHLAAVNDLYEYLRMTGEVSHNPIAFIEKPKQVRGLPKQPLTVEEMALLLSEPDINTARGCRDSAIMELLYSSGIRRAELLGLDINSICFETKTARVMGKGSKERIVPFGRICNDALIRYLHTARPILANEKSGNALFLQLLTGERLGHQGLKCLIEGYTAKAGFQRTITPHIFRHSAATHLIDSGADVRQVQELLGHACLSTTAIYCHVTINRLKKVHAACHPRERAA